MIFLEPIILSAEFAGNMLLIIIVGLVFAEYFSCIRKHFRQDGDFAQKRHEIRILLGIAVVAAIWLIAEFFIDAHMVWYHLAVHLPIVIVLIFLLIHLARKNPTHVSRMLLVFLILLLLLHPVLDIIMLFADFQLIMLLRAIAKFLETLMLFFFILKYLINAG